jgi:hypothetical protein
MSTRECAITISNGNFTISLTTKYEKGSRIQKKFFQGNKSYVAAEQDVDRLLQHLVDRKRVHFFQKTLESTTRGKKRPNSFSDGTLYGSVRKIKKKDNSRKYARYRLDMSLANKVPKDCDEWDAMYCVREPNATDRALRQFSRNPIVRTEYITQQLHGKDDTGVRNAIAYVHERIKTLSSKIIVDEKKLHVIRDAICDSSCYKLLLKAKLEEDDGLIDLTVEEDFSMTNVSKEQLARVGKQAYLVSFIYEALIERSQQELQILQMELHEIKNHTGSVDELKQLLNKNLILMRQYKESNSMGIIADKVNKKSNKKISSKTLRKWYNEYEEKGKFKEDLRGCYERNFLLTEYGYKRRFELYLKNECHLSVDAAKIGLQRIIDNDPPVEVEGKKAYVNLQPLSRRTIHRWMLKCGCKYEKVSISYYTDSHEAE